MNVVHGKLNEWRFLAICSLFFYSLMAFANVTGVTAGSATEQAPENGARATFRRLADYLRSDAIQFRTSYDAHNASLGKSRGSAKFFIGRPNLLRIEISAAEFSYLIVSEGMVLTIYNHQNNKYAQLRAPEQPRLAANLFTGLATSESQVLRFLGVVDLVARGDANAKDLGPERIQNKQCNHFSLKNSSKKYADDWEVWLQETDLPLPCKTVVRNEEQGNVQTNVYEFTNYPAPLEIYTFQPPPGSVKVDVGDLGMHPLY